MHDGGSGLPVFGERRKLIEAVTAETETSTEKCAPQCTEKGDEEAWRRASARALRARLRRPRLGLQRMALMGTRSCTRPWARGTLPCTHTPLYAMLTSIQHQDNMRPALQHPRRHPLHHLQHHQCHRHQHRPRPSEPLCPAIEPARKLPHHSLRPHPQLRARRRSGAGTRVRTRLRRRAAEHLKSGSGGHTGSGGANDTGDEEEGCAEGQGRQQGSTGDFRRSIETVSIPLPANQVWKISADDTVQPPDSLERCPDHRQ